MRQSSLAGILAALLLPVALLAATPDQPSDEQIESKAANTWIMHGGEFDLRFNKELLEAQGLRLKVADDAQIREPDFRDFLHFPIYPSDGLELIARNGNPQHFVGGKLSAHGGFKMHSSNGAEFDYSQFELRADPSNRLRLLLVGKEGEAWFYVNHMMFKFTDNYYNFFMRSADLNATAAFAKRVGAPTLADAYIGEIQFNSPVVKRPTAFAPPQSAKGAPNFPGSNGFEADVLLSSYTMRYSRCRTSGGTNPCVGGVGDDGDVVFTPSSTLRNTDNGNSADVPWYGKFTVSPYDYPYPGNDQHPYLVWNLYRITDGQLQQVAASGTKHAFLTVNTGCSSPFGNHILSPDCGDTYGTGNNDSTGALAPRSEVVPATGRWGRCSSIFDTNCDGNSNNVGNDSYQNRMIVRESQLLVPNSQFYSDSWYIILDDVNIFNTMGHRSLAPGFTGNAWTTGTEGAFNQGPVIDTWVNPASNPNQNVLLDTAEGHAKLAVKVKMLTKCPAGSGLEGTCYRYDYAVNNFDLSRAVLNTNPPADSGANLQVVSNKGFVGFSIPRGVDRGVFLEPTGFADIDTNAGNDWNGAVSASEVSWTSVAGNELDWGLLFRFSLVTNVASDSAQVGQVTLQITGGIGPTSYTVDMMVPNTFDLFADSMED